MRSASRIEVDAGAHRGGQVSEWVTIAAVLAGWFGTLFSLTYFEHIDRGVGWQTLEWTNRASVASFVSWGVIVVCALLTKRWSVGKRWALSVLGGVWVLGALIHQESFVCALSCSKTPTSGWVEAVVWALAVSSIGATCTILRSSTARWGPRTSRFRRSRTA
jgi:hypothetical protein